MENQVHHNKAANNKAAKPNNKAPVKLVEYTANVDISSMKSWHKERYFNGKEEYVITFEAKENATKDELIKIAADKLYTNSLISDYQLHFDSIDGKTLWFSTGWSFENLNTYAYGYEGGRKQRTRRQQHKRKRMTRARK
jgi:hypothetical protein